jgi:hypothetical protein
VCGEAQVQRALQLCSPRVHAEWVSPRAGGWPGGRVPAALTVLLGFMVQVPYIQGLRRHVHSPRETCDAGKPLHAKKGVCRSAGLLLFRHVARLLTSLVQLRDASGQSAGEQGPRQEGSHKAGGDGVDADEAHCHMSVRRREPCLLRDWTHRCRPPWRRAGAWCPRRRPRAGAGKRAGARTPR